MNWDNYFMNIAEAVAQRSKDPSTQVGCVIVRSGNKPVSFGYNGFIAGCDEQQMSYERPLKYMLMVHAEMNALIFAQRSLEGCKAYVTNAPCENCLKHLLQAGVREIIYKYFDTRGNMMVGDRKEAIVAILKSTRAIYRNIDGADDLGMGK